MMCSTLRCWRLYSWMRLTWMSNSASGSTTDAGAFANANARAPPCSSMLDPRAIAPGRPRRQRALRGPCSRDRSVSHPSPIVSVSSRASPGLAEHHEAARRHTVGDVVEASPATARRSPRSTVSLRSSECSAATPLTAWLPTVARCAMRTRCRRPRRSATGAPRVRRRRDSAAAPRPGSAR